MKNAFFLVTLIAFFLIYMRSQLGVIVDQFNGARLYGPIETVDNNTHYSTVKTHNLHRGCIGSRCQAAGQMCHELAAANCQIPTWRLNDCWLNTYSKCAGECKRSGGRMCDCSKNASEQCGSNNDPAEACYASVHQKCMAGMFDSVPDPDRQQY